MAKRILLADDSITIQKVVELTFSDGDYEVTAVNNGTKAIQKLSEMRPDIILSDIIMPEKNGYEVCEYVKSHPEFRGIPVILLTGTFEPFDPDRADKAGCDAVVTKPFESQSLIHKVEELIEQARSQAPTMPAGMPPADSPFAAPTDNFSTSAFQAQGSDIFGGPPSSPSSRSSADTPFDMPASPVGETKTFPSNTFGEMSKATNEPAASAPPPGASAPEASPWDDAPPAESGATKAFPKMSFEELHAPAASAPPPPPAAPEPSPWDEAPAATSGETKAFPRMSFEELHQMASTPASPEPEPAPWGSASSQSASSSTSEPSSPWDEPAGTTGGETKAFPRMSFEELQQMASTPAPPPAAPASSEAEEMPFASSSRTPEPEPAPMPQTTSDSSFMSTASSGPVGELTDEQVDRIARRVVQLMSEQVVKNIAWEVIPDLAEMVVKERIRQLESEA